MLVPFVEQDFLTEARTKVTEQFKGKDIFDRYLQVMLSQRSDIQQVFKDLIQLRSIDEAKGEQLDVIGRIVGQPRTLISLDVYAYFAFNGYPNAQTYGSLTDPSVGGVWYSEGSPDGGNYTLDDNTYRLFIKSKILKNRTASTPEELLQFLSYLFGNIPIYLKEGDARFTIFFGRPLSQLEENLLSFVSYELGYPSRLIPKTLGVGIEFGHFESQGFFAFQGVPNALGFGDANTTSGFGNDWGFNYGSSDGGSVDNGGGIFASYNLKG